MVSKFYFSLTVMKLIVAKKIKPLSQLPDCQNAARKSFFVVNFTDFIQKVCLTKIIKLPRSFLKVVFTKLSQVGVITHTPNQTFYLVNSQTKTQKIRVEVI